jgi:membrane fusion protein (multidrug efflux system)
VNNSDGSLKPGVFARVLILTDKREKALTVPKEAVFQFAGLEKAFVIENGKVSERIVRTGAPTGTLLEVVDGLKEGDVVAISNPWATSSRVVRSPRDEIGRSLRQTSGSLRRCLC